jgi:hypothetical protein
MRDLSLEGKPLGCTESATGPTLQPSRPNLPATSRQRLAQPSGQHRVSSHEGEATPDPLLQSPHNRYAYPFLPLCRGGAWRKMREGKEVAAMLIDIAMFVVSALGLLAAAQEFLA